ncbi:MAG: hypothetical protein ACM3JB_14810 [Acidobacteriaceae bacterium]
MQRVRYGAWFLFVVVLLLFAFGSAQTKKDIHLPEEFKHFETRPCIPLHGKGGIGIVNARLFVVTKTPYNEIILRPTNDGPEHRWRGKTAAEAQLVFIHEGEVWEREALPRNFDLAKSVVISFEREKIRIFSFQDEKGCYYLHESD